MLSFKVTYAIQIFDLLQKHKEGMNISDIRDHFPLLPVCTIISNLVRQMELARFVCRLSSTDRRLRVNVSLNELTLHELVRSMDDEMVLGQPVGFRRWPFSYLEDRPRIVEIEQQLEEQVTSTLKSVTIGELLTRQEEKKEQTENIPRSTPVYQPAIIIT